MRESERRLFRLGQRARRAWLGAAAIGAVCCGGGGTPAGPGGAPTTAPAPRAASIDDFLARCPTAAEVRSVDGDLRLVFDSDPTRGEPLACTASAGSADLTVFQKRVYQALVAMRLVPFDAPLPWTSLPLYEWLRTTIGGIHFRSDIATSFCCEAGGMIVIGAAASRAQDNSCLLFGNTTRWIAPGGPCGMDAFIALVVHEARHNDFGPHTCGSRDRTIDELGAWSVQYYLFRWYSEHSGAYLAPAEQGPADFYRTTARSQARDLCSTRFCDQACPTGFVGAGVLPTSAPGGGADWSSTCSTR